MGEGDSEIPEMSLSEDFRNMAKIGDNKTVLKDRAALVSNGS